MFPAEPVVFLPFAPEEAFFFGALVTNTFEAGAAHTPGAVSTGSPDVAAPDAPGVALSSAEPVAAPLSPGTVDEPCEISCLGAWPPASAGGLVRSQSFSGFDCAGSPFSTSTFRFVLVSLTTATSWAGLSTDLAVPSRAARASAILVPPGPALGPTRAMGTSSGVVRRACARNATISSNGTLRVVPPGQGISTWFRSPSTISANAGGAMARDSPPVVVPSGDIR